MLTTMDKITAKIIKKTDTTQHMHTVSQKSNTLSLLHILLLVAVLE